MMIADAPIQQSAPIEIAASAPVDPGAVDAGVDSEPPVKPQRTPRPRQTPGIAPA